MDTNEKIYDVVMERFKSKRIPQKRVAAETGVPFSTVTKIAQGDIKAPNVHHIQTLYDYFMKQEAA